MTMPIVSFYQPWRVGQVLIRITHREFGSVYFIRGVKLWDGRGLVYRIANGTKPHLPHLDGYIEVEKVTEADWVIEKVMSKEAERAA